MVAVLFAEPAAAAVESLLERLRLADIRIPCPASVRDYLTRYPDVPASVRNAAEVAVPAFAGRAVLSLELYVDPEIDDRYLTLYVRQEKNDPNLFEMVRRVREGYDCTLDGSNGCFWVMTDFQPPK